MGIRFFFTFPNSINPNMNAIARPKFELTYYDITVQYVNHNATETPTLLIWYMYACDIIGVSACVILSRCAHALRFEN